MNRSDRHPGELTVPARSFVALRRALRREAGPRAAMRALRLAGFECGMDLRESLREVVRTSPGTTDKRTFWTHFEAFWKERSWGTVVHEALVHPAIGILRSRDWPEADAEEEEREPACSFTAGMFSSLLSDVANAPVDVLEFECRSRGDDACGWAFGPQATIRELYRRLDDGMNFSAAVGGL